MMILWLALLLSIYLIQLGTEQSPTRNFNSIPLHIVYETSSIVKSISPNPKPPLRIHLACSMLPSTSIEWSTARKPPNHPQITNYIRILNSLPFKQWHEEWKKSSATIQPDCWMLHLWIKRGIIPITISLNEAHNDRVDQTTERTLFFLPL